MNRADFFAHLRKRDSGLFGTSLSQGQVDGTDALLDAGAHLPLAHMAHVLAEVYHETGGGMYPVKETVFPHSKDRKPSDETVKARLSRAWKAGKLPWVKSAYWIDGYFGRGQIQITHDYNYRKASMLTGADLLADPNRALELPVSAQIAVEGCRVGMFTGRKLADYDSSIGFDHFNARAIVNGDKHVNGKHLRTYGMAFERALLVGGWEPRKATPPAPPQRPSGWAALVAAILSIFKRKPK